MPHIVPTTGGRSNSPGRHDQACELIQRRVQSHGEFSLPRRPSTRGLIGPRPLQTAFPMKLGSTSISTLLSLPVVFDGPYGAVAGSASGTRAAPDPGRAPTHAPEFFSVAQRLVQVLGRQEPIALPLLPARRQHRREGACLVRRSLGQRWNLHSVAPGVCSKAAFLAPLSDRSRTDAVPTSIRFPLTILRQPLGPFRRRQHTP